MGDVKLFERIIRVHNMEIYEYIKGKNKTYTYPKISFTLPKEFKNGEVVLVQVEHISKISVKKGEKIEIE